MNSLPSPKKALLHLRDKMATKRSFFVSEFDKKAVDSLITFYNVIEDEVKIEHKLYYKLVFLLIRFEIINDRLNNQIKEVKSNKSIKDIFSHIEKLIFSDSLEAETTKLILEYQAKKTENFFNKDIELTTENFNKLHFSEKDTKKALEMTCDFVLMNILKQS